jgi:hypothetical protein
MMTPPAHTELVLGGEIACISAFVANAIEAACRLHDHTRPLKLVLEC